MSKILEKIKWKISQIPSLYWIKKVTSMSYRDILYNKISKIELTFCANF